jgi:hypothetical protein
MCLESRHQIQFKAGFKISSGSIRLKSDFDGAKALPGRI